MAGIFSSEPEGMMGSNVSPETPVSKPVSAGLSFASDMVKSGASIFDDVQRERAVTAKQELEDQRASEKGSLIAGMVGELSRIKQAKEIGRYSLSAANTRAEAVLKKYAASSRGMYAEDVMTAFNQMMGAGRIGAQMDKETQAQEAYKAKVKEAADKSYIKAVDLNDQDKIAEGIAMMERDDAQSRLDKAAVDKYKIAASRASAAASGNKSRYYNLKAQEQAAKAEANRAVVRQFAIGGQNRIVQLQADMAEYVASGRSAQAAAELDVKWAKMEAEDRLLLGQLGNLDEKSSTALSNISNIYQTYRGALKTAGDIAVDKDKELDAKVNTRKSALQLMRYSNAPMEDLVRLQDAEDFQYVTAAQSGGGIALQNIQNQAGVYSREEFDTLVMEGFAKNANPSKKEYVNPFGDNPREVAQSKAMLKTLPDILKKAKADGNTAGYNTAVKRVEHIIASANVNSGMVENMADMSAIVSFLATNEAKEAIASGGVDMRSLEKFKDMYSNHLYDSGVKSMVALKDKVIPISDLMVADRTPYQIGKNLEIVWDGVSVRFKSPGIGVPKEVKNNEDFRRLSSNLTAIVKATAHLTGTDYQKAFDDFVMTGVMGIDPNQPKETK